jgi:hypothetical protein
MIGGIGGGPQIICASVALPLWLYTCMINRTQTLGTLILLIILKDTRINL